MATSDPTGLASAVGGALAGFGGYLRCEECGATADLGNPGARVTGDGWPKCCGYTMRWWTQRQVDAGEAPARGLGVGDDPRK